MFNFSLFFFNYMCFDFILSSLCLSHTTNKIKFVCEELILLYSIWKTEEIWVHLPSGNGFFFQLVTCARIFKSVYLGHYFLSLFKEQKKIDFSLGLSSIKMMPHVILYHITLNERQEWFFKPNSSAAWLSATYRISMVIIYQ